MFTEITPPSVARDYQGLDLDHWDFVENESDFNWPINRTYLRATMNGKRPANRLELRLDHSMPFFDHFEISVGAEPFKRVRGNRKVISLTPGRTRIKARCVDQT